MSQKPPCAGAHGDVATGNTRAEVDPSASGGLVVIAVGDLQHWRRSGRSLPWNSEILFRDFRDLDAVLEERTPDVVLSPLLCRNFDCIDIALHLQARGWRGRLRIMVTDLPRPQIVLEEARCLAPDLDIEIIVDRWVMGERVN